jgi:hypothetical protein
MLPSVPKWNAVAWEIKDSHGRLLWVNAKEQVAIQMPTQDVNLDVSLAIIQSSFLLSKLSSTKEYWKAIMLFFAIMKYRKLFCKAGGINDMSFLAPSNLYNSN